MVQRYIRALVALGKLIVIPRKVARNYNEPNTYAIPNLGGGGDMDVMEKKGEFLNTTTPAPAAAVQPSPMQVEHEKRKANDAKASRIMREVYELRGQLWARLKGWRLDKAHERNRMALEASVGVLASPTPVEYDPELATAFWKRQAERPPTPMEMLRMGRKA
jgi:hypothetical protein